MDPSMGQLFVAELLGTMILIILGDGVVGNVVLARSKGFDAGWMVIATGWGLAVAVAVYAVGGVSGAHINPAVTIGLASIGEFEWSLVPLYIGAQFAGAIIGAVVVWLHYLPHWAVTEDPGAKLAVFSTGPEIRNPGANFLAEVIGTLVLVFGVLAIVNNFAADTVQPNLQAAFGSGVQPLIVGLLVLGIGVSLGGPTGYAINPARDLGPRIVHAILPIAGKGGSDWGYAWIPVVGPIVGGVLGALLFSVTLRRMKKLINAPGDVVREALEGIAAAHAERLRVELDPAYIVRADAPVQGKVGIVSGGGRGHEPMHGGFVGPGMLDAACPGEVFTSPTPDQMLAAAQAVDGGAGVLSLVKNYTGDVLNFEIAAELAEGRGRRGRGVVIDDDVAVQDCPYTAGRRGVGTTVLAEKICGAAAEEGRSLAEVAELCRKVNAQGRSMGMALTSCTVPEAGKPTFELGERRDGGRHRHPRRARTAAHASWRPADEIAAPAGRARSLEDLPFGRATRRPALSTAWAARR